MALNFFKVPRTQKFDYKPRFWDPKKEDLEERMSKYHPETKNNGDTKAVKSRLAKGFRKGGGGFRVNSEVRAKANKRSNRILIYLVIGLSFITYVLFENYMPVLLKMLE